MDERRWVSVDPPRKVQILTQPDDDQHPARHPATELPAGPALVGQEAERCSWPMAGSAALGLAAAGPLVSSTWCGTAVVPLADRRRYPRCSTPYGPTGRRAVGGLLKAWLLRMAAVCPMEGADKS